MKAIFKFFMLVIVGMPVSAVLKGQDFISFDAEMNQSIERIFKDYQRIDSFDVQFEDKIPKHLYIYFNPDSAKRFGSKGYYDYSALDSQGDALLLYEEYPSLKKIIFCEKFATAVLFQNNAETIRVLVKPGKSYLKKGHHNDLLFPIIKAPRLAQLIQQLNDNYDGSKILDKDSVIVFQSIVDRDGSFRDGDGNREILYGSKNPLYYYFLEVYQDLDKKLRYNERRNSYNGIIIPLTKDGRPYVSLVDVYLKLNTDLTFTVSISARERKLKVKEYKKRPYDAMFSF